MTVLLFESGDVSVDSFLALDDIKVAQIHLARGSIVSDVELGAGALPSVVTPKIKTGLLTNVFLQKPEVSVSDLKVLALLGLQRDELHLAGVIAAPRPPHVSVEAGFVSMLGDTLSSCEHRRVVMKKVYPVMDIVPERHLVSNVAHDNGAVGFAEADDATQGLHHRDAQRMLTFTRTKEETVEISVLQGMVDLAALYVIGHP